jgi:hypothetical protein
MASKPPTDLFGDLAAQAEKAQDRSSLYDSLVDMQDKKPYEPSAPALTSTTLLTALAQADPKKDVSSQLAEDNIKAARDLLEQGGEQQLRYQIAGNRAQNDLAGVRKLGTELGFKVSPAERNAFGQAYRNILQENFQKRARTAIEDEAVDRIQSMAVRNPVQAKVLLDLLEKGDANETIHNFNVKMSILHQRSEELDNKYQQSGWGRAALNFILNLVPTNYNFARSGVVDSGSLSSWFAVGNGLRDQSEKLWSMPMDEFTEFTAKDGPLMQSIKSNATTVFDMTSDPKAAVEIMSNLTTQTDNQKLWNNVWGGVEIASAVPWMKIGSATRTLMAAGDTASSVRNLENAMRAMDEAGTEVAFKATGVTEDELAEEVSIGAVKPRGTTDVPLSEQVATRREAAQKALEEMFAQPESNRFRTPEELQAAFESTVEDISNHIGRPVKDVKINRVSLAGGQHVNEIEFTFGKKNGHGFASEKAARQAYNKSGLAGEVVEVVHTPGEAIAPPTSNLKLLAKEGTFGEAGSTVYKYQVENGDSVIPFTLHVDTKGAGRIDIGGLNTNELGTREVRAIAAQLADEVPSMKTLQGPRVTGARGLSKPDNPVGIINMESLRGRIDTFRDMSGQWFVRGKKVMNETGFFTDPLHPQNEGFLSRLFGRYTRAAPRVTDEVLHGAAIEGGEYLNRSHKIINGAFLQTFAKLPHNSRELIRNVALLGSKHERFFTPEEFHDLTERTLGRRATEVEEDAYNKMRLYNDMDWELRNTALYLDKVMQGKESVKFSAPWGEEFDLDAKVDYNLNKIPLERIYDASANKHYVHGRNPMTTDKFAKMKADGYVMLEIPDGFLIPEDAGHVMVNRVMVKKSDLKISPLRKEQLAYSEGGHRMYADKVFVKQGRMGIQSDTGGKYLLSPHTFRTAKNIAEGKKWADVMNEARLAVKENPDISEVDIEDNIFKNDPAFVSGREFLDSVYDGTINLDHPFEAVWDRDLPSLYNTAGKDVARLFNEDDLGITGYFNTTGRMYLSPKGRFCETPAEK